MNHDTTTCSNCQENKVRIRIGTSPNKKRTYYKDESGGDWRGRVCPKCTRAKHAAYMRKRRSASNDAAKRDPKLQHSEASVEVLSPWVDGE